MEEVKQSLGQMKDDVAASLGPPKEFFMMKKKKIPVIFKEEYSKPWFFYDSSVQELNQQLQNAAAKSTVVRNLDHWPNENIDINRIRFECSHLTDSKAIEQKTIIKERLVHVKQLPSSDAPAIEAVVDVFEKTKNKITGNREHINAAVFEFRYYFETKPESHYQDIEMLLRANGLKPLMAHHWKDTTFHRPTTCSQCNKFIWGLIKQGMTCRVCRRPFHERCVTLAPPHCAGVPMTKQERRDRAIRKVWNKFDVDGNGSLSYKELTEGLGMTGEEVALFFKAYDTDKNARLDYDEFLRLVYNHFLAAFRQFDRNDDGEITPLELKSGFKDLGLRVSNVELLDYLDKMDENDDGVITLDEFIEGCFISIALKAASEELKK